MIAERGATSVLPCYSRFVVARASLLTHSALKLSCRGQAAALATSWIKRLPCSAIICSNAAFGLQRSAGFLVSLALVMRP